MYLMVLILYCASLWFTLKIWSNFTLFDFWEKNISLTHWNRGSNAIFAFYIQSIVSCNLVTFCISHDISHSVYWLSNLFSCEHAWWAEYGDCQIKSAIQHQPLILSASAATTAMSRLDIIFQDSFWHEILGACLWCRNLFQIMCEILFHIYVKFYKKLH
jgi:hypothetical protein